MKRVEIEVPDRTYAQVQAHVRVLQEAQREAQARWDALPPDRRENVLRPEVCDEVDVLRVAVVNGVDEVVFDGRYPNSVLSLGVETDTKVRRKRYGKGEVLNVEVHLPIGVQVLAMTASESDGPNWDVYNLCFGTMNVVNPQGRGPTPLSELTYLTNKDLLGAFYRKRTKVDVCVVANLVCRTEDATFDGYRIHLWQEEQNCALATRLEDADADVCRVRAFPRERVAVNYGLAVDASASSSKVLDLLRDMNDVLADSSGIWPDTARAALVGMTARSYQVEVRADVQARTAEAFIDAREKLLLRLRSVAETAGVCFQFSTDGLRALQSSPSPTYAGVSHFGLPR